MNHPLPPTIAPLPDWSSLLQAALDPAVGQDRPALTFLGSSIEALATLNHALARVEERIAGIWKRRQRLDLAEPFSRMTSWSLDKGAIHAQGEYHACSCCGSESASATFPFALLTLDDPTLNAALKAEQEAQVEAQHREEQAQAVLDAEQQRHDQASAEQARRALYETLRVDYESKSATSRNPAV